MKRTFLATGLVLIILISCFHVLAGETRQMVNFAVSQTDSGGYFTVSVNVYNVQFNGLQAAISYDPSIAYPVSTETGKPASSFAEACIKPQGSLFSEIWTGLSEGQFNFVSYLTPGNGPLYSAGENGVTLFQIKFKRIKTGSLNLAIDTSMSALPQGFILTDGKDEMAVNVKFSYPDTPSVEVGTGGGGGGGGSTSKPTPTVTPTVTPDARTREARIQDTVILQIDNYAVVVNGNLKFIDEDENIRPYIKNDRTMVPLRLIAEAFGKEVTWQPESQGILISGGGTDIQLHIGDSNVYVNGEKQALDAAPELGISRTFVPIRFIAETLGKDVAWYEKTSCVVICPSQMPWEQGNKIDEGYLSDALMIMSPLVRDFGKGME